MLFERTSVLIAKTSVLFAKNKTLFEKNKHTIYKTSVLFAKNSILFERLGCNTQNGTKNFSINISNLCEIGLYRGPFTCASAPNQI